MASEGRPPPTAEPGARSSKPETEMPDGHTAAAAAPGGVLQLEDGHAAEPAAPQQLVPTLAVDGAPLKLDNLGPVIVNEDGSLGRIANWHELSEREQQVTLRRIPTRNKERLAALQAAGTQAGDAVGGPPAL